LTAFLLDVALVPVGGGEIADGGQVLLVGHRNSRGQSGVAAAAVALAGQWKAGACTYQRERSGGAARGGEPPSVNVCAEA
jgi:hypothetical protein